MQPDSFFSLRLRTNRENDHTLEIMVQPCPTLARVPAACLAVPGTWPLLAGEGAAPQPRLRPCDHCCPNLGIPPPYLLLSSGESLCGGISNALQEQRLMKNTPHSPRKSRLRPSLKAGAVGLFCDPPERTSPGSGGRASATRWPDPALAAASSDVGRRAGPLRLDFVDRTRHTVGLARRLVSRDLMSRVKR